MRPNNVMKFRGQGEGWEKRKEGKGRRKRKGVKDGWRGIEKGRGRRWGRSKERER